VATLALTAREVETGSGTTRLLDMGERLRPGHTAARLSAAMG
jgi:hypothetical protein